MEALGILATAFTTPSIATGLRAFFRKETKALTTCDESKIEAIETAAARKEMDLKIAENNELERARIDWVAAKDVATATQMLVARKRPSSSKEGPKGKRGRKPKYESAEERKKALALKAKGRREAKKKSAKCHADQADAGTALVPFEEATGPDQNVSLVISPLCSEDEPGTDRPHAPETHDE